MQQAMSPDRAKSQGVPPFWSTVRAPTTKRLQLSPNPKATMAERQRRRGEALSAQARFQCRNCWTAFGKIARRIEATARDAWVPFDAPLSALTGRVREAPFATAVPRWPELRAPSYDRHCTQRHRPGEICGGALRRFLLERDSLARQSR